jgi:hypothetical protein
MSNLSWGRDLSYTVQDPVWIEIKKTTTGSVRPNEVENTVWGQVKFVVYYSIQASLIKDLVTGASETESM